MRNHNGAGGARGDSSIQVVRRIAQIFSCFEEEGPIIGLARLAQKTGLPKTTVHRIVTSLQAEGLVAKAEGGYRLGHRLFRWGLLYQASNDLRQKGLPILEKLRDATGEMTHLFTREGRVRVCMEKADSPQAVRTWVGVGNILPLHVGSAGKVLLAYLSQEERDLILNSEVVPNREALEAALEETRRRGWASSFEEREKGLASASAPIFDHRGSVVAAIGVSGPIFRFTPERAEEYSGALLKAARDLSQQLGYNPATDAAARGRFTEGEEANG